MTEFPLVLTIEETAKALRIGRSAAYDAARRGEIPSVRIGRTLRVPRHALDQMLAGGDLRHDDAPAGNGRVGTERDAGAQDET